MKRSGRSRGNRERVEGARRQAALALGRDPDALESRGESAQATTSPAPRKPPSDAGTRRSEAIGVLTLGEAATRLGMSPTELEAMVERGAVQALPTAYTRTIPTTEVTRLQGRRRT